MLVLFHITLEIPLLSFTHSARAQNVPFSNDSTRTMCPFSECPPAPFSGCGKPYVTHLHQFKEYNKDFKISNRFQRFHIRRTIFHENIMKLSSKYPLYCTPGSRDSPHRIGSGSGTGHLDYASSETLPFKYFFV